MVSPMCLCVDGGTSVPVCGWEGGVQHALVWMVGPVCLCVDGGVQRACV